MLVPTSLLDENSTTDHLLAGGINVDDTKEEVVVVRRDAIISALIVIPSTLLKDITSTYGDNVSFTTPLLTPAHGDKHEVLVHLSKDQTLLCISLFNGGDLIFAELFEIMSTTDILYWLTRLGSSYDLNTYTIFVDGANAETPKLLKNYYKNIVICE